MKRLMLSGTLLLICIAVMFYLSSGNAPQINRSDLLLWRTPPQDLRIVMSPATRCKLTTAVLGRPFETDQRLSTHGDVADLLVVAG